jgi:hypothetical protein
VGPDPELQHAHQELKWIVTAAAWTAKSESQQKQKKRPGKAQAFHH